MSMASTSGTIPSDRSQGNNKNAAISGMPVRQSGVQQNIETICAIEQEALTARTLGERIGDVVARHAGQMWFILAHATWFGGWIGINAGIVPGLRAFDPFPFSFLTFVVSLEAIFLSLFILMSQNRATRQADARAHLDLQINLLAEQESTKTLQLLQRLCVHHGLAEELDPEVGRLQAETLPEELLRDLKESLPENC
jgi:uncharacterized membrane protein